MTTLFVAASGTGVGKTLITAALTHQLRQAGHSVCAVKPVISGFAENAPAGSDTAVLLESLDLAPSPENMEAVSPWRFSAPLSPDMAAAREGCTLDLAAIVAFCRRAAAGPEDVLLIEGVGGVMVPLTRHETVLDWMAALDTPAVIVAGSYLGTISHTLTAVAAVRSREIAIAAVLLSESPESPAPIEETRDIVARFLPDITVAVVPRITAEPPWRDAPDLTWLIGSS